MREVQRQRVRVRERQRVREREDHHVVVFAVSHVRAGLRELVIEVSCSCGVICASREVARCVIRRIVEDLWCHRDEGCDSIVGTLGEGEGLIDGLISRGICVEGKLTHTQALVPARLCF
jgi:hypothetical protein